MMKKKVIVKWFFFLTEKSYEKITSPFVDV